MSRTLFGFFAAAGSLVAACLPALAVGPIAPPVAGTCLSVLSAPVEGVEPNALPFAETFERYAVDDGFAVSTHGWLAEPGDSSTIVDASAVPVPVAAPCVFAGRCLRLATEGLMLFNATTGRLGNVWVDLSASLVPCEDLLPLESLSGKQFALMVNAESNLVALCGVTGGYAVSAAPGAPALVGRGVRLTVQIAYDEALTVPFFRVFVDQQPVGWDLGYELPDEAGAGGGTWLPCALPVRVFYGVGFGGTGHVDSLTLSGAYLGPAGSPKASLDGGFALSWLTDYGRRYQVECCSDLASAQWQPFGAPVTGDGRTCRIPDVKGTSACGFFRIVPLD